MRRMRKGRRKRNNPNAGFTLIEIVLSIAILAVVSLPLLRYFTDSMRYSLATTRKQRAMFLAGDITEGLLAEDRLVVLNVDADGDPISPPGTKYKIPYFDDDVNLPFNLDLNNDALIKSGTGQAVYKTTADGYNGYDVKVTITNLGDVPVDEMQDLSDYGIDLTTDVVHADTVENSQAVFELKTLYDNDEVNSVDTDIEDIKKYMSRNMNVVLSIDPDSKYRVEIYYQYTCYYPDGGSTITKSWPSDAVAAGTVDGLLVMSKAVKDLKNICIYYDWCKGGDTVTITAKSGVVEGLGEDNKLGLNIICQQRESVGDPGSGYTLEVKLGTDSITFSSNNKPLVYTNVGTLATVTVDPNFIRSSTGRPEGSGDGRSALTYSILTEVYPLGSGYNEEDRLAVIETTKGE